MIYWKLNDCPQFAKVFLIVLVCVIATAALILLAGGTLWNALLFMILGVF